MKKQLLAGLLVSATLVGIGLSGGLSASAAVIDSVDTEVGIGFTGHGGGTPGPLEIKWAPLKLDFQNANEVNTVVQAFPEIAGNKKYVVVSDTRAGATDEWKVTAQLTDLKNAKNTETLTGAILKFDSALKGYEGVNAPEAPGSIVAPGARTATVPPASQVAAGGAAVKVMEDGTGSVGTFQGASAMEMDNIALEVPANAAKAGEQYTGTLTWSLDDVI
ncbi:WxL domain-containing protein [Enterococcus durans]|uniref:WxL domain-containing protein n=1 Tax=Enterococcus durans TaxID=53345 RepID=UPI000F50A4D5|nr:WxL domain-containing protein [Enterococcus durans]ROX82769.1 WxL domain-containing protein [Enterococcus durans]